ncbi:hypothetical protein D3C78_1726840 [compost metagenome]
MKHPHIEIAAKFFSQGVVMGMPANGVSRVCYLPSLQQHLGGNVHVFGKDHMLGKTTHFLQQLATIGGKGV